MGILDWLGIKSKSEKLQEALNAGAIIVDVRTPQEFKSGHVKGSQNIPLASISNKINELKKSGKSVITCCASGARSASAASILRSNGIDAINGGPWTSVRSLLKS